MSAASRKRRAPRSARSHALRRGTGLLCLLCVLLCLVVSCGDDGHAPAAKPGASAGPGPRYGYGPAQGGAFTYQPDVVIIGGGSEAVRSVRSDGLAWTIDGHAPGARDLAPGKIMFATSESVGRVVKVEPAGEDIVVTLAPVELTDVVKDGRIAVDQAIDLDAMSFQVIPDLPGALTEGEEIGGGPAASPNTIDVVLPTAHILAVESGPKNLPGPEPSLQAKTKVGDWDVTAMKSKTKIGITAERGLKQVSGLKANISLNLLLKDLRVLADVPIANGVVGPSKFRIDGVTGITLDLAAGAAGGNEDNRKVRIEFPIEIKQPMVIGGFPATLKQRFKFLVETAFSAKNGNLSASGVWRLDGPIGFDGTTLTTPAFSTEKSILDSLTSISPGANGIVTAAEFRFTLGVGLPVAGAGPYAALVGSFGLTHGSSLGIVQCRGATLVLNAKGGVGISISTPLKKALDKVLGVKVPEEKDLLEKDIVNRSQTVPDVPACTGPT
ncbi:MAG TPA: hypothetical protein VM925_05265 [Labilithrix sp.]|nr:hypothetical protein [Labilithrix sp.]